MAIATSLLPVSAFLLALVVFDSFKLVPWWVLLRAVASGALAALTAGALHGWLLDAMSVPPSTLSHWVAPVTEETVKAVCVVYPLLRRQVGFLVDAAIIGFAVGTGFALVENVEYVSAMGDRRIWLWIARGFGTAVMHASTAATVAIVAKSMLDRESGRIVAAGAAGLCGAVLLHGVYNRALVSPLLAALLLVVFVPIVLQGIYRHSERQTREWVGDGIDLDVQLLDLVKSHAFGSTKLGRYLQELRQRFPGPVVADMFCLLQLNLELSIRAKGLLMAREAGLEVPPDGALRDRLAERDYLQKAIGATGLAALRPLQVTSDRDEWHQHLLFQAGGRPRWYRRWLRLLD